MNFGGQLGVPFCGVFLPPPYNNKRGMITSTRALSRGELGLGSPVVQRGNRYRVDRLKARRLPQ